MSYKLKRILEKIVCEKAPGPSPTFTIFHILRAIELIAQKPIGRSKLAEELKLGPGAIRTLIERLKAAKLITISKAGCTLTSKGLVFWKEYKSIFEEKTEIEKNELAIANYNFAILVKNSGHKIKSGVEQRDAAIVAGAKGATTIVMKHGRLLIPAVSEDVDRDFPQAASQISDLLKPQENDVVIVASADDPSKAEYGVLAAAWTLINE
jgi:predicted transcriptional regulator